MTQRAHHYTESAIIGQFRDAMAKAGMPFSGDIQPDLGDIKRFTVDGDRKASMTGWYVLYTDGIPAGSFGCWKRGITVAWCAKGDAEMSPAERAQVAASRAAAEAARKREEEDRQKKAEDQAGVIWDAATPCDVHPYLARKGVKSHGLRVGRWTQTNEETGEIWVDIPDALLVPIRDGKKLVSLQAIFPNKNNPYQRDKTFLPGGKKRGCLFAIGKPSEGNQKIYICEGYATGASIHEATGCAVVVAFDASNLAPVAERIRRQLPDAEIVIAADNDRWTERPVVNPGVHFANDAASRIGATVMVPEFADLSAKPTDFNDLHAAQGLQAVAQALTGTAVQTIDEPRLPALSDHANDNDPLAAMANEWAFVAAQRKFIHVPTMRQVDVDAFNLAHIHIMEHVPQFKKMKPAEYVRRVANGRVVHDLMYLPPMWNGDPFFSLDGVEYLNTYNANTVPDADPNWRDHDAWQICLDHLKNIMPRDWQQLLYWMAHNVQHPGRKILWAPVIVGMPGDGKTTIAKMLTAAMGRKHTQAVGPEALNSDFNGWAEGKCVTTFEEIRAKGHSRHDFMNKLKPLITNEVVDIVAKGKNSRNVANTQNYLALSNFRDALVLDADDRRWGVFFTRFESRNQVLRELTSEYWSRLNDYAIKGHPSVIRGWLLSIDLAEFNPNEGPAMTDAKRFMIQHSLSSDAQSVAEVVGAGAYGVNLNVVETKSLNDALRAMEGRTMQTSRMSVALREIGFTKADKTIKWNGRPCWIWTRAPFVFEDTPACRDAIRNALNEHKPPPPWEYS